MALESSLGLGALKLTVYLFGRAEVPVHCFARKLLIRALCNPLVGDVAGTARQDRDMLVAQDQFGRLTRAVVSDIFWYAHKVN